MKAWAIFDTDGGRVKPFPLVRHIFPTKAEATMHRKCFFDPKYYPVREIEITWGEDEKV